MAKFKLEIGLDNAAMREEDGELSGLAVAIELRRIADRVEDGIRAGLKGVVFDANGANVGEWRITR
jgi:hypothetical protein